jgi:hypothetical protein
MNIRAKIFGGSIPDEPVLIKAKTPKGAKADALDSIPVARAETRRANTREDDRHRLTDERVEVVCEGRSYDLELVNLSGGGAMVAGDLPAKLWDRVDLRLGSDGVIECAVSWIRDGRTGLEFAQETRLDCSVDEQSAVLREVIARSFPEVEIETRSAAAAPVKDDSPEQRGGGRRHPLIWSGVLHHDFESHPVRLRNISSTGAMIECPFTLRVGAEPLLELGGGIQLPATVSWAVGDTAGLRFSREFDLSDLSQSRPEVAAAQWERPAYLKDRKSAASAETWQHMSLGELRQELEGFWKR